MYFLFLFAALASPEWTEREAASAALSHLIDRHPAIYGPRLAEWAKDATEPEVRSRCRGRGGLLPMAVGELRPEDGPGVPDL